MSRERSRLPCCPMLGLVLGVLAGCGSSGTGSDTGPDVEPSVEIGTGDSEFEPIEDGDELPYVLGAQGGFHFFGSVRASGIEAGDPDDRDDPRNPTITFRALRDSEQIDKASAVYQQGLDPVQGMPATYEMVGRRVILDITRCDELEGARVRFEVEVRDADGETLDDARMVTAVNHPINDCF